MNKKGFVISTTLYGIFGVMLITVSTILFVLSSNRTTVGAMNDKVKMCVEECNSPEDLCEEPGGLSPMEKLLMDNELQTTLVTSDTCADGIFADADNDGLTIFFRGNVDNNYIKYGKDKNGNDLLWRIVRLNGDGSLRIILNKNIDYKLVDADGNVFTPTIGHNIGMIHTYDRSISPRGYVFYNISISYSSNMGYYYHSYSKVLTKSSDNIFKFSSGLSVDFDQIDIYDDVYTEKNIYYSIMNDWFTNSITLGTSHMSNDSGKFCNSQLYYDQTDKTLKNIPNENFKCDNDIVITNHDPSGNNRIVTSSVGFLSYGEFMMGTNTNSTCSTTGYLRNNGNFVLGNSYNHTEYNSPYKKSISYYVSDGRALILYKEEAKDNVLNNERVYYDNTFTDYYNSSKVRMSYLYPYGIRPVINLNSNIKLEGSGTQSDPYTIVQ